MATAGRAKRARRVLCEECGGFHDAHDLTACRLRQGIELASQLEREAASLQALEGGGSGEGQAAKRLAVGSALVAVHNQPAAQGVVSRLLYSLHGAAVAKPNIPTMSMYSEECALGVDSDCAGADGPGGGSGLGDHGDEMNGLGDGFGADVEALQDSGPALEFFDKDVRACIGEEVVRASNNRLLCVERQSLSFVCVGGGWGVGVQAAV